MNDFFPDTDSTHKAFNKNQSLNFTEIVKNNP